MSPNVTAMQMQMQSGCRYICVHVVMLYVRERRKSSGPDPELSYQLHKRPRPASASRVRAAPRGPAGSGYNPDAGRRRFE